MATERSRRRVRCKLCGRAVTLNNFTHHQRQAHPEAVGVNRRELYTEMDSSMLPAVIESKPSLPPLGLDDLDGLVMGVVAQLAEPKGLLPIEHLPALFVWREATATFLRSIEGHR